MVFDFTIREGTSKRIQITGLDANGNPYNFTSTTVHLIAKAKSGDATSALDYTLAVDGLGAGVSTPASRMFLGRPNPLNYSGPLTDTAATSGYITVRFPPADTVPLVTTANKPFAWEARVTTASGDSYTLESGTITVTDSLFDS